MSTHSISLGEEVGREREGTWGRGTEEQAAVSLSNYTVDGGGCTRQPSVFHYGAAAHLYHALKNIFRKSHATLYPFRLGP